MEDRPGGVRFLIGVFLFAVIAVWSCGDEQIDEEETGAESLGTYRFSLETDRASAFLTLSQPAGGRKRFIEVRSDDRARFTGTYEPGSGRVVLDEGVVLHVSSGDYWDEGPGDLTFLVEEDIEVVRDFTAFRTTFPELGTFAVTDGLDTVRGTFAGITGPRGVSLSINGSGWTFFQDAAFAGLYGVDADIRERKASLTLVVVNLLMRQVFFIARTFDLIHEHKQGLLDQGSLTFSCNDLSLLQGTVPETGFRRLTWFDDAGDDLVGQGDGFRWDLVSCCEGDNVDLVEGLVSGRADFTHMVEARVRRDGRDILARFGFDQGSGAGVRFTDFVVMDVQDDGDPLVINENRSFTLNGEFSLVFSEE